MSTPRPGAGLPGEWLTLDESIEYARVDAGSLTTAAAQGLLGAVLPDPWAAPNGALIRRRAVDAWWRTRVLAR